MPCAPRNLCRNLELQACVAKQILGVTKKLLLKTSTAFSCSHSKCNFQQYRGWRLDIWVSVARQAEEVEKPNMIFRSRNFCFLGLWRKTDKQTKTLKHQTPASSQKPTLNLHKMGGKISEPSKLVFVFFFFFPETAMCVKSYFN